VPLVVVVAGRGPGQAQLAVVGGILVQLEIAESGVEAAVPQAGPGDGQPRGGGRDQRPGPTLSQLPPPMKPDSLTTVCQAPPAWV